MAIEVKEPTRKFFLKKGNNNVVELEDVAPHLTPADILDVHARQHPELLNAAMPEAVWQGDELHYTFSVVAGTKG
jgi:PRTRC genetic system protein C